ncbi:MAG: hypothetical protein LH477_12495 [Nocardioides sp.]|nr:hypothetical protein [Nocardioides sp.]
MVSRRLMPSLLLTLALSLGPGGAASARSAPAASTWVSEVSTALQGSRSFVKERVAQAAPGERLAINLDIDNTSLATFYARGQAVRKVRNLALLADQLGVTVFFNTGRLRSSLGEVPQQLRAAGYQVGGICTRKPGELLRASKQRCRQRFVNRGFTIVANVGNNDTDFVGADYERAFRLPNYDGALG